MARRFLTDVELLGFALLNAKLHPVSVDPSGLALGDAGRVWFNSTTKRLMVWDGTTALNLMNLSTADGQITASKVSDFTTAVQALQWRSMAAPTAAVSLNSQKITNLATPTTATDAATMGYVDTQLNGLASGQTLKGSVRVAATANVSVTAAPAAVDGVTLANGDVVLLTGQSTAGENGPRVFTAAGSPLQRAANWDSTAEAVLGSYWIVREGSNADTFALLTNDTAFTGLTGTAPSTVFAPAPTFVFRGAAGATYSAGNGITLSGTSFSVAADPTDNTITVDGSGVSVNTGRVPRKWQGDVPSASSTVDTLPINVTGSVVTFNHGANNWTPLVVIRYGSAPPGGVGARARVEVEDDAVDANNVKITLPSAPAANNYTFMVVA